MSENVKIRALVEVVTDDVSYCAGECEYAGAELCLLFRQRRRRERWSGRYKRLKACAEGEQAAHGKRPSSEQEKAKKV